MNAEVAPTDALVETAGCLTIPITVVLKGEQEKTVEAGRIVENPHKDITSQYNPN